jgi:hypothetical protein
VKPVWLMIGGVALFVFSYVSHYVLGLFTGNLEATLISLAIFVSPILVLAGIVIYLLARKKKTPPMSS